MTLDLSAPQSWPVRMVRKEVATVLRISERELRRRIFEGRFPRPDDGKTWDRDVVVRYVKGGIKNFERRGQLSIVGGRR